MTDNPAPSKRRKKPGIAKLIGQAILDQIDKSRESLHPCSRCPLYRGVEKNGIENGMVRIELTEEEANGS